MEKMTQIILLPFIILNNLIFISKLISALLIALGRSVCVLLFFSIINMLNKILSLYILYLQKSHVFNFIKIILFSLLLIFLLCYTLGTFEFSYSMPLHYIFSC